MNDGFTQLLMGLVLLGMCLTSLFEGLWHKASHKELMQEVKKCRAANVSTTQSPNAVVMPQGGTVGHK